MTLKYINLKNYVNEYYLIKLFNKRLYSAVYTKKRVRKGNINSFSTNE